MVGQMGPQKLGIKNSTAWSVETMTNVILWAIPTSVLYYHLVGIPKASAPNEHAVRKPSVEMPLVTTVEATIPT